MVEFEKRVPKLWTIQRSYWFAFVPANSLRHCDIMQVYLAGSKAAT